MAAEREKMEAGIGGSTYDGLATVTIGSKITNKAYDQEPMDIQAMRQGKNKPLGACFKCGRNGHIKKDCPEGRKRKKLVNNFPGKCNRCHRQGHKKRDCVALTDASGNKLDKERKAKVSQVTDETEDVSSASDSDSE